MKAVILCGGQGLRMNGSFDNIPKPLIPINGKPLLHYIITHYYKFGVKEFILLVGNQEHLFEEFADNYGNLDLKVQVLQTGENTPTGGRIKKAEQLMSGEDSFFLTYGDGLADVDLEKQIFFHQEHKKMITLTAVKPHLPFGLLVLDEDCTVNSFEEKPKLKEHINGGFFIVNKEIFSLLKEHSDFEMNILPKIAEIKELKAYIHNDFWKSIDTFKDVVILNNEKDLLNNLK
jgi:glucose-1-phosphate cytidylyltransferase